MKIRLGSVLLSFDSAISRTVDRLPKAVGPAMRFISEIGLPPVGLSLLGLLFICAVLRGEWRIVLAVIAVWLGAAVVDLIKRQVHRTRPDTVYVATRHPRGYSFPSGHAADSLLSYGIFGYLAPSYLPSPLGVVAACFCAVYIFIIGLSRIYLGAHFASDVIGGWVIGGICLLLVIALIHP